VQRHDQINGLGIGITKPSIQRMFNDPLFHPVGGHVRHRQLGFYRAAGRFSCYNPSQLHNKYGALYPIQTYTPSLGRSIPGMIGQVATVKSSGSA
jgi:hypothetical protein